MCVALALAFLVSCSGGDEKAGTFAVSTTTPPTTVPKSVKTVAPGRLRPPSAARLFAGTNSVAGQLTHYCKNATCADERPRTPAFVTAPAGALVLFTIGETPVSAVADISTRAGEQAGRVRLSPGSLRVFNHGLGTGRWLVDLVVRWKGSEARWRFGLSVTS